MSNIKILFTVFLFLMVHNRNLQAQLSTNYIPVDKKCVNKYEYAVQNPTTVLPSGYSDYHLKLNDVTSLILRTYERSVRNSSPKLPETGVINCENAAKLSNAWFLEVNRGERKVYLLETKSGGGYTAIPVDEVVLYIHEKNRVLYETKAIAFEYYFNQEYASGEDVRLYKKSEGIAFPLQSYNDGLEKHIIRYYDVQACTLPMDITISREYGLMSQKIGEAEVHLATVNGVNWQTGEIKENIAFVENTHTSVVREEIKQTVIEAEAPVQQEEAYRVVFAEQEELRIASGASIIKTSPKKEKITKIVKYSPATPAPKKAVAAVKQKTVAKPACNCVCDDGYHLVGSGDNLFNIAKRYNTTPDKLKTLNGLSGDIIKLNQKLRVR